MLYVKLEWGQCCMLNWNGTNAVSELCIGPMLYVNLAYDRFCKKKWHGANSECKI